MSTELELDARRYHLLKDWLLQNNVVVHHKMGPNQTEPFVMDTHFYGNTFEDAVDTLAGKSQTESGTSKTDADRVLEQLERPDEPDEYENL
jgi:hypothetical protein